MISPRLPIETPRLRLRRLHEGDLAALYAIQSREDVCRWLPWRPRSQDEVREALARQIAGRPADGVSLAVEPVTTGELIGHVSLSLVLEKLGMRREAHLIENEWIKGEWQSELVYAVLAREWCAGRDD